MYDQGMKGCRVDSWALVGVGWNGVSVRVWMTSREVDEDEQWRTRGKKVGKGVVEVYMTAVCL